MDSAEVEQILDCIPEALFIVDSTGRVAFANSAAAEWCGVHTAGALISDIFAVQAQAILQVGWRGEVEGRTGRRFIVDVRATGNQGPFLLLVSLASADEQQRKLELLGRIASGVVHDLNNILTSILGHISFLRLSLPESGAHRDSLLTIEDGAKRAAATTQQILEFARRSSATFKATNLSFLVGAGINLLRATLPKNVTVELHAVSKDVTVVGEESQLTQLLMNLALNARDALPQGGIIRIALEECALTAHDFLVPGNYALLQISDNGVGIPAGLQDRIFEPFFTTKSTGGTGLGLANVCAIVQAHRGAVSVESSEGQGATFSVLLPLASGEVRTSEAPLAGPPVPNGNARILVVEDEEIVRTVMQRSLEHLGYAVDVASSGEEAISLYRALRGAYDLVILDIMMPQMSGDAVFHRLKELNANVQVLIASGYSSDARTRALLEAGARGFIQKPFGVEDLAWEVKRCLEQTQVPSPR